MQRADTIGVFQIESRAQMATLPRMRPEKFYDLVIEVAIIRPGPIQGELAHPYLRRRNGEEPVRYYHDCLRPVLERTLGVPLFQEQMLEMAMVIADFNGSEAEELRRALSFHRSEEKMQRVIGKLRLAMQKKKVRPETTDQIIKAIGSFALYGFPESHAISFALLAYASAYLKVHRAPEFFTALLNNQPMGFYSPATLIRDAKQRGVQIRPVCVARSQWDCHIEADASIRLGLMQVSGLHRENTVAMLQERQGKPFASMTDFKRRSGLTRQEIRTLAGIGALNCFAPHRRAALWEAGLALHQGDLFGESSIPMEAPPLRPMNPMERLEADYASLRLTTGPHPMSFLRDQLSGIRRAVDLKHMRNGEIVRIAGQVICRQRPGTARGVCFLSLEDETGISNAIIASDLFERERLKITTEPFLIVEGVLQSRQGTIHIKARSFTRLEVAPLDAAPSHDFR